MPEGGEQIKAVLGPYFLVTEVGDEIVGFVSGSVRLKEDSTVIPKGASCVEIDNLYVSPEYKRRGVGGRRVNRILAEAKERGVGYALIYSAAKDIHGVLRFYEWHGFKSWYVQMFREL